jgi:hypothetical protein
MATVAKGMITLVSLNDALSVLLSPNSCVINADFDGSNPRLDNAYTNVTVTREDTSIKFDIKLHATSNSAIQYDVISVDSYTWRIKLTELPTDILSGYLEFELTTQENFACFVTFQFTVIRESTMLDWIQDWENNKTTIGSAYMITPKIFVGKKITSGEDLNVLTGVYIGPDSANGAGIYGYKKGEDIFHINEHGGFIGGWNINTGGIQTEDGKLKILSDGSIISSDEKGNVIWGLYKSGEAIFASGNVQFSNDGSAYFKGEIDSSSGKIGGWIIKDYVLYSDYMLLDSVCHYIGLGPFLTTEYDGQGHKAATEDYGGVSIFYTNANSYGIVGYLPHSLEDGVQVKRKTFSMGSANQIAGWSFDWNSLWLGAKLNTARQYTANTGSITIGTSGMRGYGWYIDTDGEVSFAGGLVTFNKTGGTLVGWTINEQRLSTDKVALISDSSNTGLYLAVESIADISIASLTSHITQKGGIYLKTSATDAILGAYKSNGALAFYLTSTGVNNIAGWSFDTDSIYRVYKNNTSGTFNAIVGSITIGSNGIRGCRWRLDSDGAGAIAGGNISWNSAGALTFSSDVSILWQTAATNAADAAKSYADTKVEDLQYLGTYINSSGIYTGTLNASQINAGTINAARINADELLSNGNYWALKKDGSGYLANKNITWNTAGDLSMTGEINATSGVIGGFEIGSGRIGSIATQSGSGGDLAIYNNFFRVGGNDGYAMFGNNVIPSAVGGAFTAAGRIANNKTNQYGSYGYDTANYGLFIDVTGGTKNYGISSNAPLKAPGFINTRVEELNIASASYTIDFSQANIFLIYASRQYNIILPEEAAVAKMFSLSSLPNDFGFIATLKMRTGSAKVTLKNIFNPDESLSNYDLSEGDSIMLLVTKKDGFRYNVLNYHNK